MRSQCILGLVLVLLFSIPDGAAGQDIDGTARLGLTGSLFSFTRARHSSEAFDGFTTKQTSFGTLIGAQGLEVGYGVTSFLVVGTRLGLAMESFEAADGSSTSGLTVTLVPELMFLAPTEGPNRFFFRVGAGFGARREAAGGTTLLTARGLALSTGVGVQSFLRDSFAVTFELGLQHLNGRGDLVESPLELQRTQVHLGFGLVAHLGGSAADAAVPAEGGELSGPTARVAATPRPSAGEPDVRAAELDARVEELRVGEARLWLLSSVIRDPNVLGIMVEVEPGATTLSGCDEMILDAPSRALGSTVHRSDATGPDGQMRLVGHFEADAVALWVEDGAASVRLCERLLPLSEGDLARTREFVRGHRARRAAAFQRAVASAHRHVERRARGFQVQFTMGPLSLRFFASPESDADHVLVHVSHRAMVPAWESCAGVGFGGRELHEAYAAPFRREAREVRLGTEESLRALVPRAVLERWVESADAAIDVCGLHVAVGANDRVAIGALLARLAQARSVRTGPGRSAPEGSAAAPAEQPATPGVEALREALEACSGGAPAQMGVTFDRQGRPIAMHGAVGSLRACFWRRVQLLRSVDLASQRVDVRTRPTDVDAQLAPEPSATEPPADAVPGPLDGRAE